VTKTGDRPAENFVDPYFHDLQAITRPFGGYEDLLSSVKGCSGVREMKSHRIQEVLMVLRGFFGLVWTRLLEVRNGDDLCSPCNFSSGVVSRKEVGKPGFGMFDLSWRWRLEHRSLPISAVF